MRSLSQCAAVAAAVIVTQSAAWAGPTGYPEASVASVTGNPQVNVTTTTTTVNQVQTNEVIQNIMLDSLYRLLGHTERHTPQDKLIPPKHWDVELVVSDTELATALTELRSQLYELSSVPGQRNNYRSDYTVSQDGITSSQQELISSSTESVVTGEDESVVETIDTNGAVFGVDYVGDPDAYPTSWLAIGENDVNVEIDQLITITTFLDSITTNEWSQVAVWQISSTFTVTPLLLDLDGNGAIQASNGQWKPHYTKGKSKMAFYDFYGDGFPVLMEWPGPKDGILCQPGKNGELDGTRLFGTAAGYKDGYEALRVKDTNGDSTISGQELAGLAVWTDSDGDAHPEQGEVKPVSEHNISSLSVRHKDYVSSFTQNGAKKRMFDWWPQVYELKKVRLAPKNT